MPDLAARLRGWLAEQTPGGTILVVGGGALVDEIRRAQGTHRLSDGAAHWLAIRAMGVQAELIRSILPEAQLLRALSLAHFDRPVIGTRLWILEPWSFMRDVDGRCQEPLPESWDVTSDSIAARAAELWAADELVLLKSAAPLPPASLEELATAGYADRHFPHAARKLAVVRMVDLRAMPYTEHAIRAVGRRDACPTGEH